MNAFGSMGTFCGYQAPAKWEAGVDKPALPSKRDWPPAEQFTKHLLNIVARDDVRASLADLVRDTQLSAQLRPDLWVGFLKETRERFESIIADWSRDFEILARAYEEIADGIKNGRRLAAAIRYQMRTLCTTSVIEALADGQFLPRYGFPIGLHQLKVTQRDGSGKLVEQRETRFRLERSALLALAEYVPGSRLLVGGETVTSRGVLRHFVGNQADDSFGRRGVLAQCKNAHVFYALGNIEVCPHCDQAAVNPRPMLIPRHGFTTAAWDPPRRGVETEKVGTTEKTTIAFTRSAKIPTSEDFAGIPGLDVRYSADAELLVYNNGDKNLGFALCTRCGYAESEAKTGKGRIDLPSGFEAHASILDDDPKSFCWPKTEDGHVLRNHVFAARQPTDILLVDLSRVVSSPPEDDECLGETLGQALRTAGARLLDIDPRELGVVVVPVGRYGDRKGPALFDNVSGGAGHVAELKELGRAWIEEAARALYVNEAHHARCSRACFDCILSFDAQFAMSAGKLDRQLALGALRQWGIAWNN